MTQLIHNPFTLFHDTQANVSGWLASGVAQLSGFFTISGLNNAEPLWLVDTAQFGVFQSGAVILFNPALSGTAAGITSGQVVSGLLATTSTFASVNSGNVGSGALGNVHVFSGGWQSGAYGSGSIAHPAFGSGAIQSGDISSGQIGQYHLALADPVNNQDAVTLNYFNQQNIVKRECQAATVAGLAAYAYNNGASGVGATITLTVAAVLILDGYTPALNDRILVKNETGGNAPYNGIYSVTTLGTVVVKAVLTRTTDFDQAADGIDGSFAFVQNGTVNASTGWLCSVFGSITFGTTNISWTQDTGTGTYTGTAPITVSASNVIALTVPITVAQGGTNSATSLTNNQVMVSSGGKIVELGAMTNGQFIIGSTSAAPVIATISVSNFQITNGAGSITLAADTILLQEQQTSGTNGGASSSGAWRTRVLNTKVFDTGSNVASLASNLFTLVAGTYELWSSSPVYNGSSGQSRIYNTTDSAVVITGSIEYNDAGASTSSMCLGRFTIAASKALALQYQVATSQAVDGLGVAGGFGTEVYGQVFLRRVA